MKFAGLVCGVAAGRLAAGSGLLGKALAAREQELAAGVDSVHERVAATATGVNYQDGKAVEAKPVSSVRARFDELMAKHGKHHYKPYVPKAAEDIIIQPQAADEVGAADDIINEPQAVEKPRHYKPYVPKATEAVVEEADAVGTHLKKRFHEILEKATGGGNPQAAEDIIIQPQRLDEIIVQPQAIIVQPQAAEKPRYYKPYVPKAAEEVVVQEADAAGGKKTGSLKERFEMLKKPQAADEDIIIQPQRLDEIIVQPQRLDEIIIQPQRLDEIIVQPQAVESAEDVIVQTQAVVKEPLHHFKPYVPKAEEDIIIQPQAVAEVTQAPLHFKPYSPQAAEDIIVVKEPLHHYKPYVPKPQAVEAAGPA